MLDRLPSDVTISETTAAQSPGTVAVVIVTYSSQRVIGECINALLAQTRPANLVVIVDNNSPDSSYLDELARDETIHVIRNAQNEGFCRANNIGYRIARKHEFVVFLNPDAFAPKTMLEQAVRWMQIADNTAAAAVTGALLKYDLDRGYPTGKIDSTGIFQTWYGKWFDRDQGREWRGVDAAAPPELVPAICGALMFCRSKALDECSLNGGEIFDEKFFMYKEDIELSLRLRRYHWQLFYVPQLTCLHCRGWTKRSEMSARARFLSARNELRVCLRNGGKGILYTVLKLLMVPLENALFFL